MVAESTGKTLEEALELQTEEGTINDLIIAKTAKIGEKLSLRRISAGLPSPIAISFWIERSWAITSSGISASNT